jgi:hypothetical protein
MKNESVQAIESQGVGAVRAFAYISLVRVGRLRRVWRMPSGAEDRQARGEDSTGGGIG